MSSHETKSGQRASAGRINEMQIDLTQNIRACMHIVAHELMLRNASNIDHALEELTSISCDVFVVPKTGARSFGEKFSLDCLVASGVVNEEVADELRLSADALHSMRKVPPNVDALLYFARRLAAHAVAEEVSSGVPGMWAAYIAGAEALRPHARDAGENRHE